MNSGVFFGHEKVFLEILAHTSVIAIPLLKRCWLKWLGRLAITATGQ
jgi:hypothetical protein